MIGRIRGTLIEKQPPVVLVEAGGVGYEILVPMTSIYHLGALKTEVILYTHFIVREDLQQLYGFVNKFDRVLFQALIKINGIGAKMALAILSGMDGSTLVHCIQSQDHGLLCSIPGIGRKIAERLMIEMKDKIAKLSSALSTQVSNTVAEGQLNKKINTSESFQSAPAILTEAIDALEALGYKRKEAEKAVYKVKSNPSDVEQLIRLALQQGA